MENIKHNYSLSHLLNITTDVTESEQNLSDILMTNQTGGNNKIFSNSDLIHFELSDVSDNFSDDFTLNIKNTNSNNFLKQRGGKFSVISNPIEWLVTSISDDKTKTKSDQENKDETTQTDESKQTDKTTQSDNYANITDTIDGKDLPVLV